MSEKKFLWKTIQFFREQARMFENFVWTTGVIDVPNFRWFSYEQSKEFSRNTKKIIASFVEFDRNSWLCCRYINTINIIQMIIIFACTMYMCTHIFIISFSKFNNGAKMITKLVRGKPVAGCHERESVREERERGERK